jgi:hypothetical protein
MVELDSTLDLLFFNAHDFPYKAVEVWELVSTEEYRRQKPLKVPKFQSHLYH